jgi:tryptophan synthase alpha chain
MTDLSKIFAELKERHEAALIAYLTVGDPQLKYTPKLAAALIEGGADVIELGIPFSDPIADGPTIQAAVTRSLKGGAKPLDALDVAKTIREQYNDTPLVLMTYFNPIFRVGLEKFLAQSKNAGVSGIIVPDLPVEESADYKKECNAAGVDTIFLASPSTDPPRLKKILDQTSGYLYLISLYGVTGVRANISDEAVDLVRRYSSMVGGSVPLAVGFGISKADHVKRLVDAGTDGVIVGSAFVKVIGANARNITRAPSKLKSLAAELKKATTRASQ